MLSTEYDESNDTHPKLICVITGKGPLKYHYEQMILKLKWKKVSIKTPWLENNDYPLLLGKIVFVFFFCQLYLNFDMVGMFK